MQAEQNYILQLTDLHSARKCALRIDPQDATLPLSALLDSNLKHCPVSRFLREGRLTEQSATTLQALQDLVYMTSDSGRLHGMYAGTLFTQGGHAIGLDRVPRMELTRVGDKAVAVIDIGIDRTNVGHDRNPTGFHRRRWDRHASLYTGFVLETLRHRYSEAEAGEILRLSTEHDKVRLLRSLARRIWESPFENYSRFIGHRLPYKTGDETVRNIIEGAGGICSEKVQALKFLTDRYGLHSEYLLAGAETRSPVPEDRLRELLTTFDFKFAKRHMRYWQHTALLYTVDGVEILVDATNGNIPFLFLEGETSRALLGYDEKLPVTVRMAVFQEDFYYHKISQDIPESLFFAMEGWLPDIDLIQVFDNELGLSISSEFFVTPIVYKSAAGYERHAREYAQACDRAGLEHSIGDEWTLDSPLGQRLMRQEPETGERTLLAKEHLLRRYDEHVGPGHEAGLVIIGLRGADDDIRNAR